MKEQEAQKQDINEIVIVKDPYFIQYLKEEIETIKEARRNRPEPRKGFVYTRDWLDRMTDENIFTFDFFIENIEPIWQKYSKLNSVYRNVIESVCYVAYTKMIEKHKENETKKPTENTKE